MALQGTIAEQRRRPPVSRSGVAPVLCTSLQLSLSFLLGLLQGTGAVAVAAGS
jgi:hypothetical protein